MTNKIQQKQQQQTNNYKKQKNQWGVIKLVKNREVVKAEINSFSQFLIGGTCWNEIWMQCV